MKLFISEQIVDKIVKSDQDVRGSAELCYLPG